MPDSPQHFEGPVKLATGVILLSELPNGFVILSQGVPEVEAIIHTYAFITWKQGGSPDIDKKVGNGEPAGELKRVVIFLDAWT